MTKYITGEQVNVTSSSKPKESELINNSVIVASAAAVFAVARKSKENDTKYKWANWNKQTNTNSMNWNKEKKPDDQGPKWNKAYY